MKNLFFSLLLIPILGLFSFYSEGARSFGVALSNEGALPIGAAMPKGDIRVKDVSGKELTLQQARQANGLLVMFTCNTCPYVIANQSRTKEVCVYAGNRQVGVVLLNANEGDREGGNSFGEMQAYAKAQAYQWYYAIDQNNVIADAFGASRTPECYLFDKNGKLVYHGAIDDSPGDPVSVKKHHLQNALDEMVSGKEVSTKETRSVGCSIKRA